MKNLLVLILFSCMSFLGLTYAATPASQKIQIGKELPVFHSIHLTGDVKVYLHPSATNSYKAELPASLEEYFTMSVENGVLQIRLNKNISRFDMPKVDLYFSEVNKIQAEGGYYLKMDETYTGSNLELVLAGSGLTNLILDVQELKAEISGQAVASVKGKSLDAKIYGSQESYWAASALNTSTLLVSVEGMAKAEVNAQKDITAIADNSGQIHCSGEAEIRSYIHGLGSITKVPSL
jgi:hypothetical protein